MNMEEHPIPTAALTSEEHEWLASLEEEWANTTPGEWYAHHTDDAYCMSATYVSTSPGRGELSLGFFVDGGTGMAAGALDQADHECVVAITLLQQPRLVDPENSDANTLFIANMHQHMPRLLALIRRLAGINSFR